MTQHKMYCIFAKENLDKINGVRGKIASMAGHAYLHSYWDAIPKEAVIELGEVEVRKWEQAIAYRESGLAVKITLVVDTVEELKTLQESYKDICGTSLVTDAGRTVFKEPTTICLGIGPISEDNIKDDLKVLKVLI